MLRFLQGFIFKNQLIKKEKMTILAKNERQLILYYDGTSELGKKVRAHAEASGAQLLPIDITETKVAATEWTEVAELLNCKVSELIATDHPVFKQTYGEDNVNLDADDALKILEKNPETLVYPIAVRGQRAIRAKQSTDLRKLINPDTGDIPQP